MRKGKTGNRILLQTSERKDNLESGPVESSGVPFNITKSTYKRSQLRDTWVPQHLRRVAVILRIGDY